MALTAAPETCCRPARFSVAMVGWNGGLTELLTEILRDAVGYRVEIREETFVEPLLAQVDPIGHPAFDLLIVFFNPELAAGEASLSASTGERAKVSCRSDLDLLTHLRTRYGRSPLVIHNSWAGYSVQQYRQAGAGAVLLMPFSASEFTKALSKCLAVD